MSEGDRWQPGAVEDLTALLQADPEAVGLALGGSYARAPETMDAWSDVDALVVVRDGALPRFFPGVAWLAPLGALLGYEQHAQADFGTLRVCFTDFRRFDLIIVPVSLLAEPFSAATRAWQQRQVVFLRAQPAPNPGGRTTVPALPPESDFDRLTNGFWFKAALAVGKVKRRDSLGALHLSLDLLRDCVSLALMLREREGGNWDPVIEQVEGTYPLHEAEFLDTLEQTAKAFDWLAAQWSREYAPRADRFGDWLDYTRASIAPR